MNNQIICATDLSESSRGSVKWSVKLARKLKSSLTILYTYRLLKQNDEAVTGKKKIEEEGWNAFRNLERELLADKGVAYKFKMEVGFVDDRIEQLVKTNKISFVVMGRNMSVKDRESFDELLEHLQTPLVIVP
jgi:hypothetical protein